jgi:hypothetical protein
MDPQQRRYRHPSTCTALATRSTLPLTRGDVGPARRNQRTYRTAVRGGRRAVTDAAANPSSSRSVVAVWSPLSASLAVYVLGSSETAATFWPGQNRWLISLYFRFPALCHLARFRVLSTVCDFLFTCNCSHENNKEHDANHSHYP